MISSKKIGIIGSGFSGLATASYLAKAGHDVTIFEKNDQVGGRARSFEAEGFTFDMGPSWYWMPDVFDSFFADFGKKTSDYYLLQKLDPGFQVIFKDDEVKIAADYNKIADDFEQIETGAGYQLKRFIDNAEYKYRISMGDLVSLPCHSVFEFLKWDIIKQVFKTNLFSPLSKEVRKLFKHTKLRQIMEFPVIFLGAMAENIPALYSLMNYSAIKQGTFYPQGGMVMTIDAIYQLAQELGVNIQTNMPIDKILSYQGEVKSVSVNGKLLNFDFIVSSADYHHTEMVLLDEKDRNYSESYWESRVFAPTSILFYLGIDKKLDKLEHHNLFFDTDYQSHADAIYIKPEWIDEPLFYVCCPSKTDNSVAPDGKENLFILIPHAIQLEESEELVNDYYHKVISRIEKYTGEDIKDSIIFKREFTKQDFITEYNSYKGNAYGLANTLMQTAFLKPKIKNKHIKNLYYTGQLTVPGPGVPPALISGKIVANEIIKSIKSI